MAMANRYSKIIEHIFLAHYRPGADRIVFSREEIEKAALKLKIKLPKNLGDLVYTFRYRGELPSSILKRCPKGKQWIIQGEGRSKYSFVATSFASISPTSNLTATKIPDATPGLISMYALSDEQALLAKLRYNRLIDIFTGVACYSLQSHLRSTVPDMGQVETDELYVGVDRRGAHYVFPIQAKGGRDSLNVVQISQDFSLCEAKFKHLICYPIGTQFMADDQIALFAFEKIGGEIKIFREKHYQLVPPAEISAEELTKYHERPLEP
jgi:hypothetical protein